MKAAKKCVRSPAALSQTPNSTIARILPFRWPTHLMTVAVFVLQVKAQRSTILKLRGRCNTETRTATSVADRPERMYWNWEPVLNIFAQTPLDPPPPIEDCERHSLLRILSFSEVVFAFNQESPRQTKPKKGPKRKVHEFRPFLWILMFFLRKTSTIHIELLFRNPPAKRSWTDLLWFGLPGPLLIQRLFLQVLISLQDVHVASWRAQSSRLAQSYCWGTCKQGVSKQEATTFAWRPGSQYDVAATRGADNVLASDCRAQFGRPWLPVRPRGETVYWQANANTPLSVTPPF